MAHASPRKKRERRLKRRVSIAESNFVLRGQLEQHKQYLQFLSGQAFEAKALLFAVLSNGNISIAKSDLEKIRKNIEHLELNVKTHPEDDTVLCLTVEDTQKETNTKGYTIKKTGEVDLVEPTPMVSPENGIDHDRATDGGNPNHVEA